MAKGDSPCREFFYLKPTITLAGGPNWTYGPNGIEGGRFGAIEHSVMVKPDDTVLFDRPVVVEGPHVITCSWGLKDGEPAIGLVKEARDTAAPADGITSFAFWGPPRGFLDSSETPEQAAVREAGEEAGARAVIGKPKFLGKFITNETCTASWSPIVLIQFDLSKLTEILHEQERGEKIYKANWFTVNEVDDMIRVGEHEGAFTTSFVLISIVQLFKLHVLALNHARQESV